MLPIKNKKLKKKSAPKAKKKLFWSWIAGLSKKQSSKPSHPRTLIARRALTKRTIGRQGLRKVDITIIGLGLIIAVLFGSSNIQNIFKASILSLNQKNAIVTAAKARQGIGYQLGGQGPNSYDCSGLTGAVIKEATGVTLPRTSRDQYNIGRNIAFENLGVGDLVFFKTSGGETISHVGVITAITGSEIRMTHANSYTGKVQEEDIKNSTYWQKTYFGAREITEATKDQVAPSTPDTTHTVDTVVTTKVDEYNSYFPPSELNDARIKVGAATIEQSTDSTKIISDTVIRSTPNSATTVSPSPSPTSTTVPELAFVTPISTPSISPSPTALPTVPSTPTTTTTASPIVTTSPATTVSSPSPTATATITPSAQPTPTPIEAVSFSDVPKTHKSYAAIEKLVAAGVIDGYTDGTFRPSLSVSRAELLKMIYKALGKTLVKVTKSPFTDVSTTNPLFSYIINAYNSGLIKGYSNKTFRPNQSVTRAEGSKMILKGFGITSDVTRTGYSDLNAKSDLTPYIGYMLSSNLLTPGKNKALPNAALTRGEAAYMIANLLD